LGNASIILGNYPQALAHFASAQSIFENEIQTNPKNSVEIKKVWPNCQRSYSSKNPKEVGATEHYNTKTHCLPTVGFFMPFSVYSNFAIFILLLTFSLPYSFFNSFGIP